MQVKMLIHLLRGKSLSQGTPAVCTTSQAKHFESYYALVKLLLVVTVTHTLAHPGIILAMQ